MIRDKIMANDTTTDGAEFARARGAAYGLIAASLRDPEPALLGALADPARWAGWPEVIRRIDVETAGRLDAVRDFVTRQVSKSSGDTEAHPDGRAQSCDSSVVERPHGLTLDLAALRQGQEPAALGHLGSAHGHLAAIQEAHARLFGHTARGLCPLYELEYGRGEIIQQASELADISGFYSAFGLELTADANERADHISVECELMSVLAAKEAYAIDQGEDGEACDVVRGAQRSFLADHLGQWLPAFTRRLTESDPDGFYGAVGRFAAAFVASECRRLDVASGPEYLELRPVDPSPDATITCGPGESSPTGDDDPIVQIGIDPAIDTRE